MMRPLAWPVAFDAQRMASIDPSAAPRQRAGLLLATKVGERPDAPDFGLIDPLGQLTAAVPGGIEAAISRFDPGVGVNIVTTRQGERSDILVEVTP
ncbi:hypothetical protein [Stomatohabitans albus]|uniref:hypothetical protein n=1 Tax=Stomatohabitans albus TaxID=3110766 RepID=UPI00300C49FE